MNENRKSISNKGTKDCDESQPLRDTIIAAEPPEALDPARQAITKPRLRRRKRIVFIR
jgi:hypothetical protein